MKNRMHWRSLWMMSLLAVVFTTASALHAAGKPNIIVFLADDLGYGELGCYGQKKIKTPNLDQLAADGIRFTDFYAGHAVCAPSRCVMLTGKHTGHSFVRENSEGRAAQAEERNRIKAEDGYLPQIALPASETTFASALQKSGYRTACVGKWGLGHPSNEGSPNKHGFDLFYGYISQWQAHYYYPTYLWRNDVKEPLEGNDGKVGRQHAADLMEQEALKFLETNGDKPFFLYYATPVPHVSLQVPPDEPSLADYQQAFAGQDPPYDGKKSYLPTENPRAIYAAMVTRMDRTMGKFRELLKRIGKEKDTIIVFTSDNGATFNGGYDREFFGGNQPLRGMKTQLWDGGIRTPFIAAWPGSIQPGQVSKFAGASWDLFPTFAEIVGFPAPSGLDGVSILPTLKSDAAAQKQHDHLYWETVAGGNQAVRMGPWKGIRLGVSKNPSAPVQLYHLETDIAETTDVAAQHPDIVAKIAAIMSAGRVPSAEFPMGELDRPGLKP
ncbi:arylsulfatase [Verrucomicrobium sp. BvORR106]|uniref:arylsulfatase n=1 Tax=Verrucomicrobium sp. BvORR106 TaxID=1403819 RepID=UPI002240F7D1|nr:arylsulfatase [Verrucomicrobium sp. BvORR106]